MSSIQNKAIKPKHEVSHEGGISRKHLPTKRDVKNIDNWLEKNGQPKLTAKQTMRRLFGK